MKSYRCDDWSRLPGTEVEVHRRGKLIRSGVVDAVTPDSAMVWLSADHNGSRALFESAEGYEVWADPLDVPADPCHRNAAHQFTKESPAIDAEGEP
jgi:hypothetical protein